MPWWKVEWRHIPLLTHQILTINMIHGIMMHRRLDINVTYKWYQSNDIIYALTFPSLWNVCSYCWWYLGVDVFTFLGSWFFQNRNYYTSIQFDPRPKRGRWFAHHTTSSRERKLQRKIDNGAQPSQSTKEAAAKFAFFCYFCVLISW